MCVSQTLSDGILTAIQQEESEMHTARTEEKAGLHPLGLKYVTDVWPRGHTSPTQAKALKLSLKSFHSNSEENGYLPVPSFPAINRNIESFHPGLCRSSLNRNSVENASSSGTQGM